MASDTLAARMAAAVREVRREAKKAAAVPSVADGAVVALVVNLAVRTVTLPGVPTELSLARLPGVDTAATVHVAVPLAVLLGLVVAVSEYLLRTRRPPVEQFETVNPDVAEALRTARDTLDDEGGPDADSPMVAALYEDVLGRLRSASSVELLPTRRVVVAVCLALVLSVVSIQAAVVDVHLGGRDRTDGGGNDAAGGDRSADLQNGSAILGDEEDVSAGSDEVNASLPGTNAGGDRPSSAGDAYDSTGYGGDAAVESQRAGYLADDTLEESELIRDYTLKIRDQEDE